MSYGQSIIAVILSHNADPRLETQVAYEIKIKLS